MLCATIWKISGTTGKIIALLHCSQDNKIFSLSTKSVVKRTILACTTAPKVDLKKWQFSEKKSQNNYGEWKINFDGTF